MIAIKDKFNLFYLKAKKWAKASPDDVLVALALSVLVMIVAVTFAFLGMTKKNEFKGELPSPVETNTIINGWKYMSRYGTGTGYCDLYSSGMSYKVQCYDKDETGKWYLRGVY